MAIVDSKGRLFGKVSLLDIGAALLVLLVIVGVLLPSFTGAQLSSNLKAVEVDVIVRSVGSKDPKTLLKEGDKTNLIIRNQPFGAVTLKAVRELPRNIAVPQPDGSTKALPDPRPEAGLTKDFLVTVAGDANMTDNGPLLGNSKIKAGTKIELEGFTYDFADLYVIDVRVGA
ncbi:DUF4330 domain-containing protein [Phormidium sp. FACHB-592]|uniref:DUF4330 domain-containing protein n=1 Tax=Stenomitos frigidus AS-A4 TaxID=2933935 RepID=A0ABV0KGW5_9CYAN|nr:DUF4330 domain-containing protein [Phormidium sp. FACHB-592]MBD2073781.1 DUF4330 domain-containing protein [Phormidium sp. FACHB-592]